MKTTVVKSGMGLLACLVTCLVISGCHHRGQPKFACHDFDCLAEFERIEYADVCPDPCGNSLQGDRFRTGPPLTVDNYQDQEPWRLTLEQAIEITLANNKVLQKLGGRVVSSPQGTATAYDPAIVETDPFGSAEAALSDFDALFSGVANLRHVETRNNPFDTTLEIKNDVGQLRGGISKTAASGTRFNVFSQSDYNRTNLPFTIFPSTWNQLVQAEVRQPLARGAGTAVNRIAGPNAPVGSYNGVLIGRIRGDVALTDFEAAVRDLTRDVEQAYWELYFGYRDLDVKLRARESARLIWINRNRQVQAGNLRQDDESQTRQQYFRFAQEAINTFCGTAAQPGLLGAERQLRRLMGLVNNDDRLILPVTEPTIAPIVFDWDQSQDEALVNRVELRRQKWVLRQRELELFAARKLNKWQVDGVANYGVGGFGNVLIGTNSPGAGGGAWNDLFLNALDNWAVGLEVQGPLGNRLTNLAVRNAQLNVMREQALLEEQQKQILLDLNAAYNEVDRAFLAIGNQYNARLAVIEELKIKRSRWESGLENIFFLLDAQQRAAVIETAFHRSVVDYNLALQNYVFTAGNQLEYYNIQLMEGSWSTAARAEARARQDHYRYGPFNPDRMDICPISLGPVDQSTDLMVIQKDLPGTTPPASEPGPQTGALPAPETIKPDEAPQIPDDKTAPDPPNLDP